jgi:predicted HD superfamily hydrolase involved in NAD metabolism
MVPVLGDMPAAQPAGPTLAHEQRTAAIARELAALHGADPDRAELGAFLHDIADHLTDGDLLATARRYDVPVTLCDSQVPRLLHAPVGAALLQYEYGISDDELLDAVRQHIVGHPLMGPLAKTLFVANQLDPLRDNPLPGRDEARSVSSRDLDGALLALCNARIRALIDGGRPLHDGLILTRNVLLERLRRGRSL